MYGIKKGPEGPVGSFSVFLFDVQTRQRTGKPRLRRMIFLDALLLQHLFPCGVLLPAVAFFVDVLGAGVILSNVKGDRSEIVLDLPSGERGTGMHKLGALIGDGAEIGCNSVLNPGTVIGRGARVYPLISVRGYVPPRHICKGGKGIFPIV